MDIASANLHDAEEMSLLNFVIGDQAALVSVDTEVLVTGSRQRVHQSKMLPVPHANLVVAFRGDMDAGRAVAGMILSNPELDHYDAAEDLFPTLLQKTLATFRQMGVAEAQIADMELAVLMAGWSPKRNNPHAVYAASERGASGFEIDRPRCRLAPNPGIEVPRLATAADMLEVASLQVERMRREEPGQAIGGRILMATILSRKMVVEEIGRL